MVATRRIVVGAGEEPNRVDKILARHAPDLSRTTLQRWIEEGRVSVDGRAARRRETVGPGQTLEIREGPALASDVAPDASVQFSVTYEDEHLIVVDKPAGVVVHPGRGHRLGTLVAGLLARPGFGRPPSDPGDPEGSVRPGIVHRIDKGTSGLLVVAKDDRSREGLKQQLAAHQMEREYQAVTVGRPGAGRIESLHGRHPQARLKFTTRVHSGKRAITHVEVTEWLEGARVALVRCRLETGRTHQLRVHLAECTATPIFGDPTYGGIPPREPLRGIARALGRQALHAGLLGFVHPVRGEPLRFSTPVPDDMAGAISALRVIPP